MSGDHAQGTTIEVDGLTKRFGDRLVVDDLRFSVEPGRVTGFLGPNGAGKTTTLRMMLGLIAPTSGSATFGRRRYRDLREPLRTVGTALEASSFHPGRTGRDHLRVLAAAADLPTSRVDAALEATGMAEAGRRRVGGYSLGMRQRLGLSAALLGDPGVLILDEPINGLDPEGIRWIRILLRELAGQGRTVLISSHLLTEVQQTVDEVVIISRGRLVHRGRIDSLEPRRSVLVDAPDRAALAAALAGAGLEASALDGGSSTEAGLVVAGADPAEVGAIAARAGVALSRLQSRSSGIEDVFFQLTEAEYDAPEPGVADEGRAS